MRNAGKKSLIGGIVALSLILAGTGYAYWTDTLNVTTKATTGDLDVTFVDLGLYAQYDNEANDSNVFTKNWSIVDGVQHGDNNGFVDDLFFARGDNNNHTDIAKVGTIAQYKNEASGYNTVDFNAELTDNTTLKAAVGPYSTATKSSDNIVLTVNKMYPGYAQAFRTDVVNQGSIAAKLSNMSFKVTKLDGSSELSDTMKNMLGIAVYMDKDDGSTPAVFNLAKALSDTDTFKIGKVTFIRLSALPNADVQDTIKNAELLCNPESGKRMDLLLAVGMDPDADGDYTTGSTAVMADKNDADSQNLGAKISIDFLWDQFNAKVTTATAAE